MDRRRLLSRALPRLALAATALTLGALAAGAQAVLLARPLFEAEVEALLPNYVARLQPRDAASPATGGDVVMVVHAFRLDPIAGEHAVTPGIDITESVDAGHELVPVVVLLSMLAAWPWPRWRDAARALALGLAACGALLAWTVPVHLAGLYELNLQRVAAALHEARATPWMVRQMVFLESGGLWLLALLLGAGIVFAVDRRARTAVTRA